MSTVFPCIDDQSLYVDDKTGNAVARQTAHTLQHLHDVETKGEIEMSHWLCIRCGAVLSVGYAEGSGTPSADWTAPSPPASPPLPLANLAGQNP